jgi:hypothetical protein
MRRAIFVGSIALVAGSALAQQPSAPIQQGDSPHSVGRTELPPSMKGVEQPQGPTGPLETGSGGAPAESPRADTAGNAGRAGRFG